MSNMRVVSEGEVCVGKPLAWPVYNQGGRLLLRKGYVVETRDQVAKLMEKGLYRETGIERIKTSTNQEKEPEPSIFQKIGDWKKRLSAVSKSLVDHDNPRLLERIRELTNEIQMACQKNPDAVLAAGHLDVSAELSSNNNLHSAILIELLALEKNVKQDVRRSLVMAAFTYDIGMMHIQDTLDRQKEPLTLEQRQEIKRHPEHSVEILQKNGIDDPVVLDAVLHHHERLDGSGYPHGKQGEEISMHTRLLALIDVYTAMISPRAYREPVLVKETLRQLFQERGQLIDADLTQFLIKQIGVYPPGTMVRLKNGAIGVVTGRGVSASEPEVHEFLGVTGTPLVRPVECEPSEITGMVPTSNYKSVWPLIEKWFTD